MTKLNLGCYTTSVDGFTNVDMQKLPNVDILSPVDKLDFAKDESIDEILASHVLEHFCYYNVHKVLNEWNRVLKIDGILYVSVPDMYRCVEFINRYGWGIWMERMIYGDQEYEYAFHKAGFIEETLKEKLKNAGFDNIKRVDTFPLKITGKTALIMQYPSMLDSKEDSDLISLSLIARKHTNIKSEVYNGK